MQKVFQINDLLVDTHFKDFLMSSQNKCCRMLLCLDTNGKCNYIAPSDKEDMISYLPKNKLAKVMEAGIDPFSPESGRSRMKVGRLMTTLFSEDMIKEFALTNTDVEEFVNSYKSFFSMDNIELRVVEGDEIKKWYLEDNYLEVSGSYGAPLWKSCMRYKTKQPLLGLYCKNPDKVKLLIMIQKDALGHEKLRARALLWQDATLARPIGKSNTSSIKVMDRIYTIYDSDLFIFKKWARDKGYISKLYQNSKSFHLFDLDGSETNLLLSVKLSNFQFSLFPYLDTFQFFDTRNGEFFNFPDRFDYRLNHADGLLHNEDEDQDQVEPEDEPFFDFDEN